MVQQHGIGFALGLLAFNLSLVIERYAPPGTLTRFAQGVFIGLSIAANILWMFWAMARQPQ
jgi:hypothetical protein